VVVVSYQTAIDTLRWISMVWLVISMGWLIQVAVITRNLSTTMLLSGLTLSLFVDLDSQYNRLGNPHVSHQLPIVFIELSLITAGMYFYVKAHNNVNFIPPFYFFLRYQDSRRRKKRGDEPE
jgi:hypothetical protein